MEIRFGRLPDDDPFLLIMRPVTDWVFKFVSWLIIGATLVYAWEKTKSPYLAGLGVIATVFPGAFLYSFLQWLSKLERKGKAGSKAGQPAPPRGWRWKLRRTGVIVVSGLVWWALTIATQVAVQQTAAAMLEFQKTVR